MFLRDPREAKTAYCGSGKWIKRVTKMNKTSKDKLRQVLTVVGNNRLCGYCLNWVHP